MIGCARAQALAERAVLPVTFGALDGEAIWRDEEKREVGPHHLACSHPVETTALPCSPRCAPGSPRRCCGRHSSLVLGGDRMASAEYPGYVAGMPFKHNAARVTAFRSGAIE